MTGALCQVNDDPKSGKDLVLLRRWQPHRARTQDKEAAIEEKLPFWMLFDRVKGLIYYQGTTGPLLRLLENNVKKEVFNYADDVEFIYSTSKDITPDMEPTATTVLLDELITWLRDVDEQWEIGRKLYKDEMN